MDHMINSIQTEVYERREKLDKSVSESSSRTKSTKQTTDRQTKTTVNGQLSPVYERVHSAADSNL